MTPGEQAMLDQHVQAIAEILYREAESRPMETLGQIETVIRAQFQEHVGPQLGIFLGSWPLLVIHLGRAIDNKRIHSHIS